MYTVDGGAPEDGRAKDADLVSRVIDHPYFAFQLQQRIESRTDAYIAGRWKLAAGVFSAIVIVFGAVGVKEYISFGQIMDTLRTDIAAVRAQRAELETKTADVMHQLDLMKSESTLVARLVRESADTAAKITQQAVAGANQTSAFAAQSSEYTRAMLQDVGRTQEEAKQRAEELRASLTDASRQIGQLDEIKKMATDVRQISSEVATRRREVETASEEFRNNNALVTERLRFERELALAKTFEIVLIRQGEANGTTISLPDYRQTTTAKQQTYVMEIAAQHCTDKQTEFWIKVDGGVRQLFQLGKGKDQAILGTPFIVRVDSIYHAKLAFDFVLLRILPAEARAVAAAGN